MQNAWQKKGILGEAKLGISRIRLVGTISNKCTPFK